MEELDLVRAAQGGDRHALGELLKTVEPTIYRFGMRMCRNPHDAEDVLQETMLAMARNIESYRGEGRVSTWAYTIARNFCQRRRKKEQALGTAASDSELESVPHPEAGADTQTVHKEEWQRVEAALRMLSDEHREILVLRDIEQMSAPEVSDVLEMSIAAVKSRLHRARKALREALGTIESYPECPDILEAFSQHIEGDLSTSACAEMERHIDTCPRCQSLCTALRHDLKICQMAPQEIVPSEISMRIRQHLQKLL